MDCYLTYKYYKTLLLGLKRGNSRGVFINAKPVFVISLVDSIDLRISLSNQFFYCDSNKQLYETIYSKLEPNSFVTPFFKPFYHLVSDGFWHIKWKDGIKPSKTSDYKLRDNVEYACLDNALWDLLQDKQNRNALRQSIINFYFKK